MTDVDEHGNRPDDCGRCTLLPSVSGWVRATQTACPVHGTPARRVRTQAERADDNHTWRALAGDVCGNTIPNLLGGDPLVCARTAGHDGSHRDELGSMWSLPGPPGVVDVHCIVVPEPLPPHVVEWLRQSAANPLPTKPDDIERLRARIRPPRRRWWHRYTRRPQ